MSTRAAELLKLSLDLQNSDEKKIAHNPLIFVLGEACEQRGSGHDVLAHCLSAVLGAAA